MIMYFTFDDYEEEVNVNYEFYVAPASITSGIALIKVPISIDKLSTGTIDQIYLALRLAIADIICTNKERLPLLFDDCFAMYDNVRLCSTLKYLSNNINSQVIIFTCHTREDEILKREGIKYNSINI